MNPTTSKAHPKCHQLVAKATARVATWPAPESKSLSRAEEDKKEKTSLLNMMKSGLPQAFAGMTALERACSFDLHA